MQVQKSTVAAMEYDGARVINDDIYKEKLLTLMRSRIRPRCNVIAEDESPS